MTIFLASADFQFLGVNTLRNQEVSQNIFRISNCLRFAKDLTLH